ncbi:uncharacterized protein LOC131235057 isoform X2 [Magnolia sinica]|nr:uncharacterized protein LOC131235057 isoform X2 [Magnolia sinica]
MAISPISTSKQKKTKKEKTHLSVEQKQTPSLPSPPPKRRKFPGIRIVGGRIYDSEHGKSCHQCRQKTMDFVAACKNENSKNKACTIKFCHKCLLNRYGEKAEEMARLDDWKCPKCRGICNCSFCMKRKGHQPTGILSPTAKATGFSSVSELLHLKGPEAIKMVVKDLHASPNKQTVFIKGSGVDSKRKCRKENTSANRGDSNIKCKALLVNDDAKLEYKRIGRKNLKLDKSKGSVNESINDDGGLRKKDSKTKNSKKASINSVKKEESMFGGEANMPNGENDDDAEVKKAKQTVSIKGSGVDSKRKRRKENTSADQGDSNIKCKPLLANDDAKLESKRIGRKKLKLDKSKGGVNESIDDDGSLKKKESKTKNSKKASLDTVKKEESLSGGEAKMPNGENDDDVEVKKALPVSKLDNPKKHVLASHGENSSEDVTLPQGNELTTVAGIELPADDVGSALQFLEFCSAFGEVLDLKNGQPELILRELMRGRAARRGLYSSIVQFHIKLLSLIQKDLGEENTLDSTSSGNSWIQVLSKCISESQCASKDLPLDCINRGTDEYEKLDSSTKLRVLNFLCDETLCTEDLRSWIDEENSRFLKRKKEAEQKLLATKEKVNNMKKKLKDEVARAILSSRDGGPLSVSEHDDLLSKIRSETKKAQVEKLEVMNLVPKKKQRLDAVRTEPVLLDGKGRAYWRLRGCSSRSQIVLQDIGNWDSLTPQERWFTYDDEQEKVVEKYVSSFRKKQHRPRVIPNTDVMGSNEASLNHDSHRSSPKCTMKE